MDQSDLIDITPRMVKAGVEELKRKMFGESLEGVVEGVYLMMEIERRSYIMDDASSINPSR